MATDLTPSVSVTSIPPQSDDTPTATIPAAITTKPVGFLAYTNGSTPIKRHTTTHLTPKHEPSPGTMISTTTTVTVSYKECMRNHAATIGGHALDGCCEFMPSPESNPAEPTSLVCAACGCHRNFHRRDPDDPTPLHQKHHPHPHPPPSHPHLNPRTPPPESPLPPPTSTFYSSAPHFHHHHLTPLQNNNNNLPTAPSPVAMASAPPNGTRKLKLPLISDRGSGGDGSGRISRKRFRTKFTREQKERMQGFAERMGWKMQKIDRRVVEEFCEEIGVGREVLKVWMHNNKNVFVRNRDEISGHGLHNGSNNNNRQVTGGGTTSTTAVVGGGGGVDKIIGNGGDRIIHGLFYSTSSSNGGDADGGGGAGVKVERMDMTVGRRGDDDDGSGSGSGGSHRSNGVDRFEHFQVVSADGSASSSSSG